MSGTTLEGELREFGGSEKRTERETDNLLLIAPRNQNPNVVPECQYCNKQLVY